MKKTTSTLILKTLILALLSFYNSYGQELDLPNLSDDIVLCKNGVFPFYTYCKNLKESQEVTYESQDVLFDSITNTYIVYYENGSIKNTGKIIDNKPTGKWMFFYANGVKKAEGEFAEGKFELGCTGSDNYMDVTVMSGTWKFWNKNKNLETTCNFKLNEYQEEILDGEYTHYYSNGKIKEEGNYKNNKKDGPWKYWNENGSLFKNIFYTD